jgi:hypothetical protein
MAFDSQGAESSDREPGDETMKRVPQSWLAVAAVLFVLASTSVGGVRKADGGVEFTYQDPGAGSVSLAGDFNSWSTTAVPMSMDDEGVWRAVIDLAPGTYEYKFVVNGSEWIADPENPKVVGAYGNSQITINEQGVPVVAVVEAPISNTRLNSRVSVNGWYRATYDTSPDAGDDTKWRLSRPAHEFYFSVNPTINDLVSGAAMLHMATGAGDIKEITADIYSGHIEFDRGPFGVVGYYNEERVQFDNPIEMVGHLDLPGTIPEEHIAFGRGTQGLLLEADFWDAGFEGVYANVYDYDYRNNPSLFDNTDTDLLAARIKRPAGPVVLGATYVSWRDGWGIEWTGSNQSAQIDSFISTTSSESDSFGLARNDQWVGVDVEWPVIPGLATVRSEFAWYSYDNRWDYGNKERGEATTAGAIDVPIGDTGGWLSRTVVEGSPLPPLTANLLVDLGRLDGMTEGEEFVAFDQSPWMSEYSLFEELGRYPLRQYTEVRYRDSPMVVSVYGPLPEIDITGFELDLGFGLGIFDLGVELDQTNYDLNMRGELPEGIDFDSWSGSERRLAGRFRADILDERTWVELVGEAKRYEDDDSAKSLWTAYDTRELIARARVGVTDEVAVLADVRQITYRDVEQSGASPGRASRAGREDETFYAPYVAVSYSPRENIELRLGYGVDPWNYVDAPAEGRPDGRERWRDEYMWSHDAGSSPEAVVEAERALEDATTIGLMAVVSF